MTLLDEFIQEECTSEVKQMLLEYLESNGAGRQEFNFNRFNILLDFDNGMVSIEDDLDVTEAGAEMVTIQSFTASMMS